MEGADLQVDEDTTVQASAHAVWQTLVDPAQRRRWWSDLELDPVPGGRFTERWIDTDGSERITAGTVVDAEPERRLRLRWADSDWPEATDVEITLVATSAGTVVRVQHTGFQRLPDGEQLADEHRAGWQRHLSNLRAAAESPKWPT